jgi:enoyl-[acyl-carrier-protein] reductase (NADH)
LLTGLTQGGLYAWEFEKGPRELKVRVEGQLAFNDIGLMLNPFVTLTPMAVKARSDPEKAGPMLARVPLGRFIQPEEVSSAIAYLLSDGASMVNGVTLPVDGGFLIN